MKKKIKKGKNQSVLYDGGFVLASASKTHSAIDEQLNPCSRNHYKLTLVGINNQSEVTSTDDEKDGYDDVYIEIGIPESKLGKALLNDSADNKVFRIIIKEER